MNHRLAASANRNDAIEIASSAGRKGAALRVVVVGVALSAGSGDVFAIRAFQQAGVSPVSKLRPIALDRLRRLTDRFDVGPLALERSRVTAMRTPGDSWRRWLGNAERPRQWPRWWALATGARLKT
jgi:hypothetical protein